MHTHKHGDLNVVILERHIVLRLCSYLTDLENTHKLSKHHFRILTESVMISSNLRYFLLILNSRGAGISELYNESNCYLSNPSHSGQREVQAPRDPDLLLVPAQVPSR